MRYSFVIVTVGITKCLFYNIKHHMTIYLSVTQPDFPFLVMRYSVILLTVVITECHQQTYHMLKYISLVSRGDQDANALHLIFFLSYMFSLDIFYFQLFIKKAILTHIDRVNCIPYFSHV